MKFLTIVSLVLLFTVACTTANSYSCVTDVAAGTRVYAQPEQLGETITLPVGTTVNIVSELFSSTGHDTGWTHIQWDDSEGYIYRHQVIHFCTSVQSVQIEPKYDHFS